MTCRALFQVSVFDESCDTRGATRQANLFPAQICSATRCQSHFCPSSPFSYQVRPFDDTDVRPLITNFCLVQLVAVLLFTFEVVLAFSTPCIDPFRCAKRNRQPCSVDADQSASNTGGCGPCVPGFYESLPDDLTCSVRAARFDDSQGMLALEPTSNHFSYFVCSECGEGILGKG